MCNDVDCLCYDGEAYAEIERLRADLDKAYIEVANRAHFETEWRKEIERLRFALDRIAHHGPPMMANSDYRTGAADMASTLSTIARAALNEETSHD